MVSLIFWFFLFLIVYTYAGYPIILAVIARLFFSPVKYHALIPSVTIVIPAYNEEQVIEGKLENCLSLDYPKEHLQILVVADGSTDRTVDIVEQYRDKGVKVLHSPERRGKMAAINRAIPFINREIVVFSDANNMYSVDAVRNLVRPFSDMRVGAVSGAKKIVKGDGHLGESEGLYWKYESFIKKQEERIGSCISVVGEIFAIRKNLLTPGPDNIINDDSFMATRLLSQGYRIAYADNAHSVERVSLTEQEEATRRSRIIAGRYQIVSMLPKLLPWRRPIVCWMLISHKFLRPFVALAMLAVLVTNLLSVIRPPEASASLLVALVFPLNWLFLLLQTVFYSVAVIGKHFEVPGVIGKILYLPQFLVYSNISALRGLYRFLRGSQSPLWERVQRRTMR